MNKKDPALKMIDCAIRAVARKLRFKATKDRQYMLEHAADSLAEAYLIGAEECQGEMLSRLQEIRRTLLPAPDICEHYAKRENCGICSSKVAA